MNRRFSTLGLMTVLVFSALLTSCYSDDEGPQGPDPGTAQPFVAIVPTFRVFVGIGQSYQFSITSGVPVTWTVSPSGGGSITPTGLFTAGTDVGTFVIRASATNNSANTDTAVVQIIEDIVPDNLDSPLFQVGASGALFPMATTPITWSVIDMGGGSVTTAGVYTAPAQPGTYRVRVATAGNPALADTMHVRVNTPTNPISYLRTGGYILLFRHTDANVCTDNSAGGANWWRSCDTICATATARQLNAAGRVKARLIGRAIANMGALVDSIHSSEFCRCFTGADSIRRNLGLPTNVVTLEQVLTMTVYDEANRNPRTEQFCRTRRLTAGRLRVMVTHGGTGGVPGAQIDVVNLNWGDAYILRQRGRGQVPRAIEIVRTTTWDAQGN